MRMLLQPAMRHRVCSMTPTMISEPLTMLEHAGPYSIGDLSSRRRFTVVDSIAALLHGAQRRWRRERRRRKVGRAYDMALEIARCLPRQSRVLDVGCGNGFIAHHLECRGNLARLSYGQDLQLQPENLLDSAGDPFSPLP